jgi:hypothetical protein
VSAQTAEDVWAALATDLLLDDIVAFVRRFVVLSEEQADAVALWVLHTHALPAADTTPYLAITSAEKRSGKTLLLEVLELLVARPWLTGRTTAAALVRKVDKVKPTLLLDESDAAFNGDKEYGETLRGVLNTGYKRGGAATVCVGAGADITFRDFSTFSPKAIAGIGRLPDTVADRSISIRIDRKTRREGVERFRRREVAPEAEGLRSRAVDWASPNLEYLREARPLLPEEIDDRAQDVWEPLLAITEMAGDSWTERGRDAAVALSSGDAREDESLSVRLLADVRRVFDRLGVEKIKTGDLIAHLVIDQEAPWGNWYGKAITAHAVSRLLKEYRIKTMAVWIGGEAIRGYKRDQFVDAWDRYLPESVRDASGVSGVPASETAPNAPNATDAFPADGLGDDEVAHHWERLFPNTNGATPKQKRDLVQKALATEALMVPGATDAQGDVK